jgi:hypothetical protein
MELFHKYIFFKKKAAARDSKKKQLPGTAAVGRLGTEQRAGAHRFSRPEAHGEILFFLFKRENLSVRDENRLNLVRVMLREKT